MIALQSRGMALAMVWRGKENGWLQ